MVSAWAAKRAIGELTHLYAYICIPFHTNNMRTKFKVSIYIKKKVGPSAPRKGHFATPRRVNPYICIPLYFILYEQYANQISAFYLDKQKSGAFGPTQGPLHGPKGS